MPHGASREHARAELVEPRVLLGGRQPLEAQRYRTIGVGHRGIMPEVTLRPAVCGR
jgi:hypothetical protein